MAHYKIAFVGLGSIGKRHFKNVCNFLEERGDSYSIDLYRNDVTISLPTEIIIKAERQISFSDNLPIDTYYDVVFVTNPTSCHYNTINRFVGFTRAFFVEKPLFDSTVIDKIIFSRLQHVICYIACPLRYSPALTYVKDNINFNDVIAVRAMSSSYLPDWRPEVDYRKCYSAHRNMGGGVGIDLIHEWDYLTYFFGLPNKVYSIQEQISPLEIDSDDIAIYIAKTDNVTMEVHLDYFGRKTQRMLELFMKEDTIRCDIEDGQIEFMKGGKIINLDTERNDYQILEIKHFFDIIDGKTQNDSTIEHAFQVLKIAKGENL